MRNEPPQVPVLERMEAAVEKVRQRLVRATAALERAGVPYAVIGGNAVAAWVATVDEIAVRATRDVDVLLRRADFDTARRELGTAGFAFRHVAGVDLFLDEAEARAADGVHVIFASERVRPEYAAPAPSPDEAVRFPDGMSVLNLEALVRMKLTSYRRKDQVHLLDLIGVGLVTEEDVGRFPGPLADRLRELLADRDG